MVVVVVSGLLYFKDTCEEVRERFMEKLNKYLFSLQLPLGYLSMMVYAGVEPHKPRLNKVTTDLQYATNVLTYDIPF